MMLTLIVCLCGADETVASEYAVLMVQAEWRSFMMRRRRLIETFHGSEGGTLKVEFYFDSLS